MNTRSEIARLILASHTDTSIARRLGVHRATVNSARHALRRSPAYARERLDHEEIPTGRMFAAPGRQPTSPAQAAANLARLQAALADTRKNTAA